MRFSFYLILLLFAAKTQAQQGFTFVRFSTEDNNGLASNAIFSLYQDTKGFMWLGTANGLQRFDGSKFHLIKSRSYATTLPASAIQQILPVGKDKLLLNFQDRREIGIFNATDYSYRTIQKELKKDFSTNKAFVWKTDNDHFFVNIENYGTLSFNADKNIFVDNHPFDFPAGYFPSLTGVHFDDMQKRIWFACNKGLCVFDQKTKQIWYTDHHPSSLQVLDKPQFKQQTDKIFLDKKRRFWIFTNSSQSYNQQRFCTDSTGNVLVKDTAGLTSSHGRTNILEHFFESSRSGLWIYGNDNLLNWDNYSNRFHFTKSTERGGVNSIEYDKVNDIIEDKDGNLWIASDKGLYFTSFSSGTYSIVNYLFDEDKARLSITGLLQLSKNELYFSSRGKGLLALDGNLMPMDLPVYKTAPPANWPEAAKKATRYVASISLQKNTGSIWLGCDEGVIVLYHPVKKTTSYLRPEILAGSAIQAITEDPDGQIWIGTASGKIVTTDGNIFKEIKNTGAPISVLFKDKQGNMWAVAAGNGLYLFDKNGQFITIYKTGNQANDLTGSTGAAIGQLNDSIMVYGSDGLNLINKKTNMVRRLRIEDGLPSNSIDRLHVDKNEMIWMITANGLSRYNPQINRFTPYGRKDGITVANQTRATAIFSADGKMIFAGQNALLMFDPAALSNTEAPPDVAITDFKIFNKELVVDSLLQLRRIDLASGENSFSIQYASVSYQQQNRLTYYYKMDGIDTGWNKATTGTFQNYSLLPPGHYSFHVYAENMDGVRSANITTIDIFIQAPFWRRPWFILLVIACIAGFTYWLHRQRIDKLMAVEKMRHRVARDLHDDMGSTLSTINILSSMAKTKMQDDAVKAADYLGKISENSQHMMEAMDDIVWSIKPSNDSMQKIVARMRELATDCLEPADIVPHFTVSEDVYEVKLGMEARRDYFLLFKESMNNAAKYSKATDVWINIKVVQKSLSLEIIDNGIGFDPALADGNGLGNMKKRADSLKGDLQIITKKEEGTRILLTIPFHQEVKNNKRNPS